jgi:hypothetical protein
VAIGAQALFGGGSQSVAIGNQSMLYGGGLYNVIIGNYAGSGGGSPHTNNLGNVALGYQSLYTGASNSSDYNVLLGYQTGYSLNGGDNNIFIGKQAGYSSTGSDSLIIENSNNIATPLIGGNFSTNDLSICGDLHIQSSDAFYLGDEATDGTWRIARDGNNLVFQRRESGNYVTKQTMTP